MITRLPIRWRLTIWYTTFLAAALILFGVAVYVAVRIVIFNTFEEQLRNRTALAKAAIDTSTSDLRFDQTTMASLRDDEQFVRLLTPDGRVVLDTSQDVEVSATDASVLADAFSGKERLTKVSGEDGQFWVISTPVRNGEAVVGVLEIGSSSEDEDELLRILLITLGIAAPVVLGIAAGGGYVLSGRTLRPVDQITKLASNIGGDDLHSRLGLDLPDDELGRLARTFDAMLSRIEDAFKRQRQFTGDAAHELRTPLTLLRSQVDIALARSRSPDEYRAALIALDGDIDRLTGLVSSLLTLARADSGQLSIERATFDIKDAIQVTLDQYIASATDAKIALYDDSSSVSLSGDEDLIIQVLINLLDNALAHTSEGGTVTVGDRIEGNVVHIWVEDTGIGIAPEHIEQVFNRFYRVDSGRTRRVGGTGLGLAISKSIVEAHGGTINVTSNLGSGTRVEIVLPPSD